MASRAPAGVMAGAAAGAGLLGVFTFFLVSRGRGRATGELGLAAMSLVLNVTHGGLLGLTGDRLGAAATGLVPLPAAAYIRNLSEVSDPD